jgi:hypothetical protein
LLPAVLSAPFADALTLTYLAEITQFRVLTRFTGINGYSRLQRFTPAGVQVKPLIRSYTLSFCDSSLRVTRLVGAESGFIIEPTHFFQIRKRLPSHMI